MRGEGEERRGSRGRRAQGKQPTRRVCKGGPSTLESMSCDDGWTPLMFAVKHGDHKAIVKYLVNNHADPNKGNNSGVNPLHVAALLGHCEIAECLLSKGANVDPLDQDGDSPLKCAASKGHERMVTLLLKHNADYNRLSNNKTSPLLASVYCESLGCLEALIQVGADVNGTGCFIHPVMLAALEGYKDCLQCLLRNGADPNMPDFDCNIPIDIAAAFGWVECVEILLPYVNSLPRYQNMTSAQIVQREVNERLTRSSTAIERGDAAFGRKEHDIALASYTEAIKVGYNNPDLYAKRSLCHLQLRDAKKSTEDAITYMNIVCTDLSKPATEADARKLVMEFAKAWEQARSSSREGSGNNRASREGHP